MDLPDFLSSPNHDTLIVYGQVNDPLQTLKTLRPIEKDLVSLTSRYAMIKQDLDGFRFSSSGWTDFTFNDRMALTKTFELYLLCREKIMRGVSDFSLPLRKFLTAYLDFIWEQTIVLGEELKDMTGSKGSIFSSEDWGFSGWLPLPQAHVLLPPAFDEGHPHFAEVDLVFWGDQRLIAVCLEGGATQIPSKRQKRDFLFDKHPLLDAILVSRERLSDGKFPADLFPINLTRYWDDVSYPLGPAPPKLTL